MGHYFFECNKRKQNKLKRKNFKKNNYKKYYYRNNKRNYQKNKRYANFIQKDNYNTSYVESFSKDYNTEDTLDINLIEEDDQINNIITPKKELICWILDSGASINITNCLEKLTNIRKCHEKIYFANSKFLIAKYIGTFIGYINNYKFIIEEVYYSSEINKNLLSIEQLTKQNYKIIFNYSNNQSYATIYDKYNNKIQNVLSNRSNTFKIWISTQSLNLNNEYELKNYEEINYASMKTKDKINLWHRRFAHFDIKSIRQKLLKTDINLKCPLCIHSKLRNKPFHPSPTTNSNHIFELIHMDLVGPITESIYGNKYFLSILDDYSRFG